MSQIADTTLVAIRSAIVLLGTSVALILFSTAVESILGWRRGWRRVASCDRPELEPADVRHWGAW